MTIEARIACHIAQNAQGHADELARQAHDAFYDLAANCESPIEQLFLAHLMFIKPQCIAGRYAGPGDRQQEARLVPQYVVGGRRLDFAYLVYPLHETWEIKLGIECDGHAFHSSVEQRANDNLRGVEIVADEGFNIIRFSGSQINADPAACARRVEEVVDGIYQNNVFAAVNRVAGMQPIGPLLARIVDKLGG